ncbi:hypothetical protein yc1106_07218 [Curvularia clavata]|uniref:Stress-associated endoplasmic reticulum protein n=1 Tax=Curvularia clavata TaxID=95742 RepID=A0A9Q9DVK1_CURCL|nr:hypothetical protein yc1106_07218 [Curvularia clavata]
MAQTPQQRQANMRFAKAQEKKMGKPDSNTPVVKKQGPQKSPISKAWISTSFSFLVTLAFLRESAERAQVPV